MWNEIEFWQYCFGEDVRVKLFELLKMSKRDRISTVEQIAMLDTFCFNLTGEYIKKMYFHIVDISMTKKFVLHVGEEYRMTAQKMTPLHNLVEEVYRSVDL